MQQLPPRHFGPALARHRMAAPADADDLTVLMPGGGRCRFSLDCGMAVEAGRESLLIRRLERHPLP
ncbi:MAG: hypothetical protein ACK44A_00090 [Roseateles sp.]